MKMLSNVRQKWVNIAQMCKVIMMPSSVAHQMTQVALIILQLC